MPSLPHDALVRIEGVTHTGKGKAIRSDKISVGSSIVVAMPAEVHGSALPFIVGQVVDAACERGVLVLAWFVPELARVENVRGGKNVDVFGPWVPASDMATEDSRHYCLPDPILNVSGPSILEANFDLTDEQALLYDVLDAVRTRPQHEHDTAGQCLQELCLDARRVAMWRPNPGGGKSLTRC